MPQAAVTDGRITAIDFEGNRAADEAAKRAAHAVRVDNGIVKAMKWLHDKAVEATAFVARLFDRATPHGRWHDVAASPAPPKAERKAGRARLPPLAPAEGGHVWRPVPGTSGAARRWRCEACGTRTGSLESRRRERCRFPVYAAAPLVDDPAYQLVQEVERDAGHGHFLNFTSPFVWCSRCGRHTSATGRATGLHSVCPGRPLGRGGATRLSWLKQDCHPDTKAALLAKRVQLGQVWKPPEPARAQPASLPPVDGQDLEGTAAFESIDPVGSSGAEAQLRPEREGHVEAVAFNESRQVQPAAATRELLDRLAVLLTGAPVPTDVWSAEVEKPRRWVTRLRQPATAEAKAKAKAKPAAKRAAGPPTAPLRYGA